MKLKEYIKLLETELEKNPNLETISHISEGRYLPSLYGPCFGYYDSEKADFISKTMHDNYPYLPDKFEINSVLV